MEYEFGDEGWVLVRYFGIEFKVRVMIEGLDKVIIEDYV